MTEQSSIRGSFVPRQPSLHDYGFELEEPRHQTYDTMADEMDVSDSAAVLSSSYPSSQPHARRHSGRAHQNTMVDEDDDDDDEEDLQSNASSTTGRPHRSTAGINRHLMEEEDDEDEDFAAPAHPSSGAAGGGSHAKVGRRASKPKSAEHDQMIMSTSAPSSSLSSMKYSSAIPISVKQVSPSSSASTSPSGKSDHLVGGSGNKKHKVCVFCGTSDTPMWRRGPDGKGTLCNACGVKWSLKFRKRANSATGSTAPASPQLVSTSAPSTAAMFMSNNNAIPNQATTSSSISIAVPKKPSSAGKKKKSLLDVSPSSSPSGTSPLLSSSWSAANSSNSNTSANAVVRKRSRDDMPNSAHAFPVIASAQQPTTPAAQNAAQTGAFTSSPIATAIPINAPNNFNNNNNAAATAVTTLSTSVTSNSDDLLNRLVRAVEDQLLEVAEAEQLRRDVQSWGKQSIARADENRQVLDRLRQSMSSTLNQVRDDLTHAIDNRQAQLNFQYQQWSLSMANELEQQLRALNEQLATTPPTTNQQQVQQTLVELQRSMMNHAEMAKSLAMAPLNELKQSLPAQWERYESAAGLNANGVLDQSKAQLQNQFDAVVNQASQLDSALINAAQRN